MNRRNFLKKSIFGFCAASAPMILPSSLFGKNAPSNKLGIALIGCGDRGSSFFPRMAGFGDTKVVALCDPKLWRAKALAEKLKDHNPIITQNFLEILDNPEIDAVAIATADRWHVPISILAARNGKHVYCEKGLSVSIAESQKLRQAVCDTGVVFQYGAQQRSDPTFRRAVELVRNGYIGNVQDVYCVCADLIGDLQESSHMSRNDSEIPKDFDYDMWLGRAPLAPYSDLRTSRWGGYHNYGTALGFLSGWGAHPLDIVQWGLNMDNSGPTHIEGTGLWGHDDIFDTVHSWDVQAKYANGTKLHFYSGTKFNELKPCKELAGYQVLFKGDEGHIAVNRGDRITYSNKSLASVKLKPNAWRAYPTVVDHSRNYIDCCRTGMQAINPVEAAIRSDSVSILSDIAIRTGKPIIWDPKTETAQDKTQQDLLMGKGRSVREKWDLI